MTDIKSMCFQFRISIELKQLVILSFFSQATDHLPKFDIKSTQKHPSSLSAKTYKLSNQYKFRLIINSYLSIVTFVIKFNLSQKETIQPVSINHISILHSNGQQITCHCSAGRPRRPQLCWSSTVCYRPCRWSRRRLICPSLTFAVLCADRTWLHLAGLAWRRRFGANRCAASSRRSRIYESIFIDNLLYFKLKRCTI